MASELKVDKFTGVTTAGSIDVTGEGNSTTTNLQQGLAKAWFNLNASPVTARDSFNIGSFTDEGTGLYEGNFTSAMNDGNYAVGGTLSTKGVNNSYAHSFSTGDETNSYGLHSTAAIRANCWAENISSLSDSGMVQVIVHGDLA